MANFNTLKTIFTAHTVKEIILRFLRFLSGWNNIRFKIYIWTRKPRIVYEQSIWKTTDGISHSGLKCEGAIMPNGYNAWVNQSKTKERGQIGYQLELWPKRHKTYVLNSSTEKHPVHDNEEANLSSMAKTKRYPALSIYFDISIYPALVYWKNTTQVFRIRTVFYWDLSIMSLVPFNNATSSKLHWENSCFGKTNPIQIQNRYKIHTNSTTISSASFNNWLARFIASSVEADLVTRGASAAANLSD